MKFFSSKEFYSMFAAFNAWGWFGATSETINLVGAIAWTAVALLVMATNYIEKLEN